LESIQNATAHVVTVNNTSVQCCRNDTGFLFVGR